MASGRSATQPVNRGPSCRRHGDNEPAAGEPRPPRNIWFRKRLGVGRYRQPGKIVDRPSGHQAGGSRVDEFERIVIGFAVNDASSRSGRAGQIEANDCSRREHFCATNNKPFARKADNRRFYFSLLMRSRHVFWRQVMPPEGVAINPRPRHPGRGGDLLRAHAARLPREPYQSVNAGKRHHWRNL